jgi:hypothetical protein
LIARSTAARSWQEAKVDEGENDVGDRDAAMTDDPRGVEATAATDGYAAKAWIPFVGDADFQSRTHPGDFKARPRGIAAQRGALAACQHCGHPSPLNREVRTSDRVNPAPDGMQPAIPDALSNRTRAVADADQLLPSDDEMLPPREIPDAAAQLNT